MPLPKKTPPAEAPVADSDEDFDLEKALDELTPEQAEMFVAALELTMRKRRLLLIGNLAAAFAILLGTLLAFYVYGGREPGTFRAWVFLVPFGVAGALLLGFGRLARRLRPPPESSPGSP